MPKRDQQTFRTLKKQYDKRVAAGNKGEKFLAAHPKFATRLAKGPGANQGAPVIEAKPDQPLVHGGPQEGGAGVAPPPLDPLDALQNSEAHASIYGSYRDQIALLNQQRALSGERTERTMGQLRDARFAELQSAAGAAQERGVLGSSTDFTGRMGIRDDFLSRMQEARTAASEGRIANLGERMAARRAYETGVINLQAIKAGKQSLESIDDLLNDTNGGGGGKGKSKPGKGGRGGGNNGSPKGSTYEELLEEYRKRRKRGHTGTQFLLKHKKFANRLRRGKPGTGGPE